MTRRSRLLTLAVTLLWVAGVFARSSAFEPQDAARAAEAGPDLHPRRRPDPLQELCGLSSSRGDRPDVVPHV